MRPATFLGVITITATAGCQEPTVSAPADEWITVNTGSLSVRAVRADSGLVPLVGEAIRGGEVIATAFFSVASLQSFSVSIYPDRTTLTDYRRSKRSGNVQVRRKIYKIGREAVVLATALGEVDRH